MYTGKEASEYLQNIINVIQAHIQEMIIKQLPEIIQNVLMQTDC